MLPYGDFHGVTMQSTWDEGKAVNVLCEQCGPIQVDPEGFCITWCCDRNHGLRTHDVRDTPSPPTNGHPVWATIQWEGLALDETGDRLSVAGLQVPIAGLWVYSPEGGRARACLGERDLAALMLLGVTVEDVGRTA
jgi:hypothetical protein